MSDSETQPRTPTKDATARTGRPNNTARQSPPQRLQPTPSEAKRGRHQQHQQCKHRNPPRPIGDVVYDHRHGRVSDVAGDERSEPLLPGGIPKLQPHRAVLQVPATVASITSTHPQATGSRLSHAHHPRAVLASVRPTLPCGTQLHVPYAHRHRLSKHGIAKPLISGLPSYGWYRCANALRLT